MNEQESFVKLATGLMMNYVYICEFDKAFVWRAILCEVVGEDECPSLDVHIIHVLSNLTGSEYEPDVAVLVGEVINRLSIEDPTNFVRMKSAIDVINSKLS